MDAKPTNVSYSENTHIVLPNETNTLNHLYGGELLKWLDMSCVISAHRHCKRVTVTAAVNNVSFDRPIKLGDMVTIKAHVSRAFRTSMEVWADVFTEDQRTGELVKCNSAIFTFVALDEQGRPAEIPPVIPITAEEKERYAGALRRRQLGLVLAGKMRPEEATELKALF